MEDEKNRLERIEEKLEEALGSDKKKQKKFWMPLKARVGKRKLKEGYVTVEIIKDNREIDFQKMPIIDGTIKLGDTFHAINEDSIFTYKGKPFLHQAKGKLNPFTLDGNNKTYGQKYVMARMKSDQISEKRKLGWGVSIFALVIAAIIGYALITGG